MNAVIPEANDLFVPIKTIELGGAVDGVTETKPGYLTTEFWFAVITNVGGVLDLTNAWHFVPHKWAVIGLAVINAAYMHSRGLAKSSVPYNPDV